MWPMNWSRSLTFILNPTPEGGLPKAKACMGQTCFKRPSYLPPENKQILEDSLGAPKKIRTSLLSSLEGKRARVHCLQVLKLQGLSILNLFAETGI